VKIANVRIKGLFAFEKNIPTFFTAAILKETQRAYYFYGHGEMDPAGQCARCGRVLTHPGSILIGIGPECLGSWAARDIKLETITEKEIEHLKSLVREKVVDTWLPKSAVKEMIEVDKEITIPKDHPMFNSVEKPKKKQAILQKETIIVSFPFDYATIDKVKTLPGRQYDGQNKRWEVPLNIHAVGQLKAWGFEFDDALEKFVQEKSDTRTADQMNPTVVLGLKKTLYPFQRQGVAFLENRGGCGLIADEMGLGKTIQALAWVHNHPEARPVIIVVPATLKLNWLREIDEGISNGNNVQILSGTKPHKIDGDLIIINYDILSSWVVGLRNLRPQVLILDECHYIKNNKAKRTKAVKKLRRGIPHVIALSGTPALNRPIEIYNALTLIDRTVVPDFWTFVHKYCGARHNGFAWDYNGASNTEELHQILTSTIMIRRRKKEVLSELPDKTYSYVPMEMDPVSRRNYQSASKAFIHWVWEQKGFEAAKKASAGEAFAKVEALKQIAVRGKMRHAIEWIRDFLESEKKLVVFTLHKETMQRLMDEFKDVAVKIDGGMSQQQRQAAVDVFQNDCKIRLFVGQIKAAGVGINLFAASNVVFLELPWTPGELVQAEDRCHRIGQKDAVNVYYLLAHDTIDIHIARMIDRKRKVLDQFLDGKKTEKEAMLTVLINKITQGGDTDGIRA